MKEDPERIATFASDSIFSLSELEIVAMANLRPNLTGLDMVIYVSSGIGVRHGPRIKVAKVYGPKVPTDGKLSQKDAYNRVARKIIRIMFLVKLLINPQLICQRQKPGSCLLPFSGA